MISINNIKEKIKMFLDKNYIYIKTITIIFVISAIFQLLVYSSAYQRQYSHYGDFIKDYKYCDICNDTSTEVLQNYVHRIDHIHVKVEESYIWLLFIICGMTIIAILLEYTKYKENERLLRDLHEETIELNVHADSERDELKVDIR